MLAVIDVQKVVAHLRLRGIGILITDHNVQETLEITQRAYIINEGMILQAGTPEEIAASPIVRTLYLGEHFAWQRSDARGASEADAAHSGRGRT